MNFPYAKNTKNPWKGRKLNFQSYHIIIAKPLMAIKKTPTNQTMKQENMGNSKEEIKITENIPKRSSTTDSLHKAKVGTI